MLQNYVKIAWRNIYRYPGYAVVTIFGLAVGLAGALFVLLYLQDEASFDRHHEKLDRTYRVVEIRPSADQGDQHVALSAGVLASTIVASVPEVETAVRIIGQHGVGRRTASYGDRRFYEADYLFTEKEVFDVFSLELQRGAKDQVLENPNTAVLTESAAAKYFGTEDPVGKILQIEQFGDFLVTGMVADPPSSSHLDFSMLLSLASAQVNENWVRWLDSWGNTAFMVYTVLRPDADPARAQQAINAILSSNLGADSEPRRAYLQPLADVHLGSGHIDVEVNAREGDPRYLYIFSAIGIFLVLIASINYMNMTTARSMRRAREVGMRKVAGGQRSQLVSQFLAESILTTLIAAAIAISIVGVALPFFNGVSGKELTGMALLQWDFLIILAVLCAGVGLVAGSYPALYLSRMAPSRIFSQSGDSGSAEVRLRRGLVITQFTLSIIMIAATTVVYNQMQFVQSAPLGFNADQLVVIDINNGDVRQNWETVRAEFAGVPYVQSVSTTSRVPGDWKDITQIEARAAGSSDEDLMTMHFIAVDEQFLSTFEIDLLAGRNLTLNPADSTSLLLNATAARLLGIEDANRQAIEIPDEEFRGEVVGIVDDFHFQSLHERLGPMVLGYWGNPVRAIDYFTARVASTDLQPVIDGLREVGERFDPSHPFEYNVLDQRLGDFYAADRRAGILFGLAAALAVFIACLGLAGLAAYTAERRTKEIGVRKVLGATVRGIVMLLSKDFVLLVTAAFLIAGPLAYLAMDRWLEAFAYRTSISLWVFILSGAVALAIALATVSVQAVRSALANPVESLRYE